jgi:hypothetical protein
MNTLNATALLLLLCSSAAHAQPPTRLVLHNGSVMSIDTVGPGAIQISYVQARPSLGWVRPGTVLVTGQWNGPILNGTAIAWATSLGRTR